MLDVKWILKFPRKSCLVDAVFLVPPWVVFQGLVLKNEAQFLTLDDLISSAEKVSK